MLKESARKSFHFDSFAVRIYGEEGREVLFFECVCANTSFDFIYYNVLRNCNHPQRNALWHLQWATPVSVIVC